MLQSSAIRGLPASDKLNRDVFETSDCRKTYEELKAKGGEFPSPPKEQFDGVEPRKDNSGDWFSMTQPKWM
jgi:hypothetical protein